MKDDEKTSAELTEKELEAVQGGTAIPGCLGRPRCFLPAQDGGTVQALAAARHKVGRDQDPDTMLDGQVKP